MNFRMYDNDTVKFQYEGEQFCLHVQQDDEPMNPRTDWDHPGTHMAVWWNRYNLGDEIGDKTPDDLWHRLVRELCTEEEIVSALMEKRFETFWAEEDPEDNDMVLLHQYCYWMTCFGNTEDRWNVEQIDKHYLAYDALEDLPIKFCMELLKGKMVWLPLFIYEHSGITMSCGHVNPFPDSGWDSGAAGWIYTTKNEAIKEIGYSEGDWEDRAIDLMESEVKIYDQYLTDDVYGFTLLKKVDAEAEDYESSWEEIDSCWGFFGSDIFASGIAYEVPGLREAIENVDYEEGEAKLITTSYYTYPARIR